MSGRTKGTPTGLKPPKPLFERIKLPLILVAFVAASEWASPFPFRISFPARLAIIALVLLVLRELHHARLEVDEGWAGKTARVEGSIKQRTARVSRRTWLKVQRVVTWVILLYAFGMAINSLTTRCDSAVQCAVLAPRLAIENLPVFIQFAVMVSLTLFQLGIMFYAMVKVGSYKLVMPGTVGVTFEDVYGQDDAVAKVREQVQLLEDSDAVERAGGYMPKGLLLYGPPGTGKTMLAKAAANYSSKPLILVPPGAFQATFVGINLLKIWTLFRTIRKLARRYGGVIVFLDEIDSLGSRGGGGDEGATRAPIRNPGCVQFGTRADPDEPRRIIVTGANQMGTLEAFLSAVDGMEEPRGLLNRILVFLGFKPLRAYEYKYILMGATNRMEALDPALLRAGRFGRKIHVTFPKVDGRRKTYEGYLRKVTHDLSEENVEWAARNHARGTGAEIQDIVNEALLITFRDDREEQGIVHFPDLMHAMLWTRYGESDGPFEREEARWNVAVHEAGHAVAFHLLSRHRQRIWFAPLALDTPIPIPTGWTTMGEIAESDEVIGADGKPARVVGKSPVYSDRQCYRLTFQDGSSLVSDENHPWYVRHRQGRNGKSWSVKTTGEMAADYVYEHERKNKNGAQKQFRYHVPMAAPFRLPEADLAIDPYFLGIWLGDGDASQAVICGAADDLAEILARIPYEETYERVHARTGVRYAGFREAHRLLKEEGLTRNKHIPEGYLRASYEQRLGLLQGLMDSDGSVDGKQHCSFANTNLALVENVVELLRTLGYRPTVREYPPGTFGNKPVRAVGFRASPSVPPFRLGRKAERCTTQGRAQRLRAVVNIELVDPVAVQCIAIDAEDHLFVAGDGMVVTHNSIDQRGKTGGMVAPTPLYEDWMLTREELLADIQVSLASRVAEQLVIGTTTNGHGGDAASATKDAARMVGYGQATQIGVYDADEKEVRKQTEEILTEALDACRELLAPHKADIEAVARLLYDRGTITGDEIHEMLEAA